MKQRELHAVFDLVPEAAFFGIEAVVTGVVGVSFFPPTQTCRLLAL